MTNSAQSKIYLIIICLAVSTAMGLLHAETYTIKKLNTPTICINGDEMKVGDSFMDGAMIKWQSSTQAMRVLTSGNEVITFRADNNVKPMRVHPLVYGQGKLSSRAFACVSLADHKQAFEGSENMGHDLIDFISITSSWRQDDNSYFEITITQDGDTKKLRLPHNESGEIQITRDMFSSELLENVGQIKVAINYIDENRGVARLITPDMKINILPPFIE